MHGYPGDRVQLKCIDCGHMDTFCEKDLMRTYRSAILQGKWQVAGYEAYEGGSKSAPKMQPTWHCVACALIHEERFKEARTAGGGTTVDG